MSVSSNSFSRKLENERLWNCKPQIEYRIVLRALALRRKDTAEQIYWSVTPKPGNSVLLFGMVPNNGGNPVMKLGVDPKLSGKASGSSIFAVYYILR